MGRFPKITIQGVIRSCLSNLSRFDKFDNIDTVESMDPVRNPYTPGAGTPPPELAGRDALREQVHIALERNRIGRPAESVLMVGLLFPEMEG